MSETNSGLNGVPGYSETRQLIIDTLMGRPAGHEIQPQEHQDFALTLLNYVRSVELVSASTLIGFAKSDTIPVQPENANAAYISSLGNNSSITFNGFYDKNGNPIEVTTDEDHAALIILLRRWELGYWEVNSVPISIVAPGVDSDVVKYADGFTVNQNVGGYADGDVVEAGTSVLDVVKNILVGYIAPMLNVSPLYRDFEWGYAGITGVFITYGATNSGSAELTKLEVYQDDVLQDTKDPAVSGTNYSFEVNEFSTNSNIMIKMYDSVKGFVDDEKHKKIIPLNFYYKYFIGFAAKINNDEYPHITTSSLVRGLTYKTGFIKGVTASNALTVVGDVNTDSEAYFLVMCVPEEYSVSVQNVLGGDYVVRVLDDVVPVNLGNGYSLRTKNYKVYYIGGTPSFKNLEITL